MKKRKKKHNFLSYLAGDPALDRKARGRLHRLLVSEPEVGERGPSGDADLGLDEVDAFRLYFFLGGKREKR